MPKTYVVSLTVTIEDENKAFETAKDIAMRDMPETVALDVLNHPSDGKPDMTQVLRMIFDPGTSPAGTTIENSDAMECT